MAFFFCIESKPIHASNGSTDSIHAYVMDYSIREHEIKKKKENRICIITIVEESGPNVNLYMIYM